MQARYASQTRGGVAVAEGAVSVLLLLYSTEIQLLASCSKQSVLCKLLATRSSYLRSGRRVANSVLVLLVV